MVLEMVVAKEEENLLDLLPHERASFKILILTL